MKSCSGIFLVLVILSLSQAETYDSNCFQGRVVGKQTSKPIANAQIRYTGPNGKITAESDTNGFFEICGLDKRYDSSIYITAQNYASDKINISIKNFLKNRIDADVNSIFMQISLSPSCKVAGYVKDESGNPVVGASVAAFHLLHQSVLTDTNGFYELDGLDPSFGNYQMHVKSENFPQASINFTPASAGKTAKIDVVLKKGIAVFGIVTDPLGNPLPKVTVGNTESRAMWNCVKNETDANGYYELKNVDKGPLVLWAVNPQYPPNVQRFTISENETQKQVNIQFAAPKPLHGKVIDNFGNPVANANISIREIDGVTNLSDCRSSLKTDSQGSFVIENAPVSGKMILEVWGESFSHAMPEIEIGSVEENIITVKIAGRIYGRVIDGKTGQPIQKFNVKLDSSKFNDGFPGGFNADWNRQGYEFANPDGLFDTGRETLPVDANYSITVCAQGFDLLTLDPVSVQAISDDPNRTVFKLMTGSVIEGKVVDEANQPVKGASVRWFSKEIRLLMNDEHWSSKDTFLTDVNGTFRFDSIGTGKRGIYVTSPGFAPYIDSELNLPDDKEMLSEIVLEKGAELFGTVFIDGKPAQGIRINCDLYNVFKLKDMGYIQKEAVTDANGDYHFTQLPAAKLSFSQLSPFINGTSFSLASKRLAFSSGQKLKMDFGNEQGFTVSGLITKANIPLSGTHVLFRNKDDEISFSKGAISDSNGHYKITGLSPGNYEITASYYLSRSSSRNNFDRIHESQQIEIKSDSNVNIDFGSAVVTGRIPSEFIGQQNLSIMARRWNPKDINSPSGKIKMNWEYGSSADMISSDGTFKLSNLKPGKYFLVLRAGKSQVLSEQFVIENGKTPEIKFLPANSKLQVLVTDESNNPLENTTCSLADEFMNSISPFAKTDANGMTKFENLTKGNYFLFVSLDGFLPTSLENIRIEDDADIFQQIKLQKSAIVKFVMDENFKKLITKPTVIVYCKAQNLQNNETYKLKMHFSETDRLPVYLQTEEQFISIVSPKPQLNLPAGRFLLEYEIFEMDSAANDYANEPFYTSKTEVALTTGQTTEVIIK